MLAMPLSCGTAALRISSVSYLNIILGNLYFIQVQIKLTTCMFT